MASSGRGSDKYGRNRSPYHFRTIRRSDTRNNVRIIVVIDALRDAAQELEDNQQVNDVVEYLIATVVQRLPEEMLREEVPEAIEQIGQQVEQELDPEVGSLVKELVNRVALEFDRKRVSDFEMQVGMRGFDFLDDLEDEPLPDDQIVARQPWQITPYGPYASGSSAGSTSVRRTKPIALPYPRDQYGPIQLPYGQWPQAGGSADDVAIQIDPTHQPIEQVEHDRDVRREEQRLYPGPKPDQVVVPIGDQNAIDEEEESEQEYYDIDEEEDETCMYCTETEEDDPTKGPIISACDCKRPHRYHYRCLGEWIIAYDDPMCSVCGQPFIHRWIKRNYRQRRVWGFIRDKLLHYPEVYMFFVILIFSIIMSFAASGIFAIVAIAVFVILVLSSFFFVILYRSRYYRYIRGLEGEITFKHWPPEGHSRVVTKRQMGRNLGRIQAEPYLQGID